MRGKNYEQVKEWRGTHKKELAAQQARYRLKHRDRLILYNLEWKRRKWETYRAYLNSRKARMRLATPPWADLSAIRDFYYNCPEGYHVDHVIPLNGKNVCGLHVLENLQYLPANENLRKGNKFSSKPS